MMQNKNNPDNDLAQPPFTLFLRVRYGECDPQSVVFNARYGDYVDVAMTEFFRAVFGPWQQVLDRGLDCQVVKLTTQWQDAARFDDVLALQVHTQQIGTTSFCLQVAITRASDAQAIASAECTYVMVSTPASPEVGFCKTPVPDDFRAALHAGASGITADQAAFLSR